MERVLELAWIEDFLTLHTAGSFSAAAMQRASTQPAFSRRIRQLEDWLGSPLFDRSARPVKLTSIGERFLPRAQHIHAEMLDARRATLSGRSNLPTARRIYTTPSLAIGRIPALLRDKAITNASVIVASTFGCLDALKKGHADHALITIDDEETTQLTFKAETIARERLLFVATKTIARQMLIKEHKLHGPVLAYMPSSVYAGKIAKLLTSARIELAELPIIESASAEALLALAKAGYGATWLSESLLNSQLTVLPLPALQKITQTITWLSAS